MNEIDVERFSSTHLSIPINREIEILVQKGELDLARKKIEMFQPGSQTEHRIKEHLRGIIAQFLGLHEEAYSLFMLGLERYGENVNLLRDLSSICYQLDLPAKWRFYYRLLKQRLHECGDLLSPESNISCQLACGKFLEEEGDLVGALDIYEECLEKCQSIPDPHLKHLFYLRTLPQLVRLKAQFNQTAAMGHYYSELISIDRKECPKYLNVEIQHSLMLAEVNLVGPNHAWSRVKPLLDDEDILESDRRLLYFDFIEELLIRGLPLPVEAKLYQSLQDNADSYETEIGLLAFSAKNPRDLTELSCLASTLSWSCYLRILILYFSRTKDSELAEELKNKISLILSSLSSEAKGFWFNRMKPYLGSGDFVINFSREGRTVIFQNKEVDLSRKKGMLILLEALVEKPEKSVDEMIRLLWNCDYSPENYHRLRMTVHRLNQILYELTAIPKVFEISADRLSLKPSICLELISAN